MMTPIYAITDLDQLAQIIRQPRDLQTLRDALTQFDAECDKLELHRGNEQLARGVDVCDLSTFGGAEPENTLGIFSWDADNLLWGDNGRWTIQPRSSWGPWA